MYDASVTISIIKPDDGLTLVFNLSQSTVIELIEQAKEVIGYALSTGNPVSAPKAKKAEGD